MNVQLAVRHLHTVAGEGGADGLQQAVVHVPVVPGGGPGPQEVVDAACAIARQADLRRGVGEDLGKLGDGLAQGGLDRLRGGVIGGGDRDLHPPAAQPGVVDDGGGGELAVGDVDLLVFHGDQCGIGQSHQRHRSGYGADLHIVPHGEGLGGQQSDPARQVGQGVLKGQGDGQTGHAEQGDDGGHLHAHRAQHHQDEHQPEQHRQGGAEIALDGGQRGAAQQQAVHRPQQQLIENDPGQQDEHGPEQDLPGQGAPVQAAGDLGQNGVDGHGGSPFLSQQMGRKRAGPLRRLRPQWARTPEQAAVPWLCVHLNGVALETGEGFSAHIVLHTAGVRGGDLRGDAQPDQPVGEQLVALIDPLGIFLALRGQLQPAVLLHGEVAAGLQNRDRAADRGLGEAQILGHVDGTDGPMLLPEHQDRLQIVLAGFVEGHSVTLLFLSNSSPIVAYRSGTFNRKRGAGSGTGRGAPAEKGKLRLRAQHRNEDQPEARQQPGGDGVAIEQHGE